MHPVSDTSTVAILSARVAPSMKTSIPDYQVWVTMQKNTPEVAGGHIFSSYCTCPVGLVYNFVSYSL